MEHYTNSYIIGHYNVEYGRTGWDNWARLFCRVCGQETEWLATAAEFAAVLIDHNHDGAISAVHPHSTSNDDTDFCPGAASNTRDDADTDIFAW